MNIYNVLIGFPEKCSKQFSEKFSGDISFLLGERPKEIVMVQTLAEYRRAMEKNSYDLLILFDILGMDDSYTKDIYGGQSCIEGNCIIIIPDSCQGSSQIAGLLNKGLYNALYEKDVTYQMLDNLIKSPRSKAEAELYYGLYHDSLFNDYVEQPKNKPKEMEEEYGVRRKIADGLYITRIHSLDVRKVFHKEIGEDSVTKAFVENLSNLEEELLVKTAEAMPPYDFELDPEWIEEYTQEIKKYLQSDGSVYFQAYENRKMTKEAFAEKIKDELSGYQLDEEQKQLVYEAYERELASYGKLDVILNTPDVSDIRLLNKDVITMQHKGTWYLTNIKFASKEEYEYFISHICTMNHDSVNMQEAEKIFSDPYTNPNAKLRFTVSHKIVNSSDTMSVHIRKIDKVKKTTQKLISEGFFTKPQAAFLAEAVRQRKSIIVVGGSGSGKTIMINWMLRFPNRGICGVCVQESDELFEDDLINVEFKHSVSAKGESKVEHTLRELATMALLKNTQLFIIGEIKGDEARDFFTAGMTGSQTVASTHGDTEFEAIPRLVDLSKYKSDYSEEDLTKIYARITDFVVYMENYKVQRIAGVVGWDDDRKDVIYDLYDFEM